MISRTLLLVAAAAAATGFSVSASATPIRDDARLTQGPPVRDIIGPYDAALQCLAGQLTDEQRQTTFAPGFFPDRTGRLNFAAESGAGNFSTQGAEDMISSSLALAGVQVVDMSPMYRQGVDWVLGKVAMSSTPVNIQIVYPDVVISGAITSLDFLPGGGANVNIAGVQLGRRQARILVAMDGRAVAMPGNRLQRAGGIALSNERTSKQIVGYEDNAGVTRFFGRNSPVFVSAEFGRRPNEALQYAQRIMVDRLVFRLVSQTFGITACEPQLEYGDTLGAQPEGE